MGNFLKRIFTLVIIFGLFFGVGCGVVGLLTPEHTVATITDEDEGAAPTVDERKRTNILLLGIDARKGETISRTDTIILASIDPKLNKVALVSVPRDTKISGSSMGGMDKINAANVVGGPELSVKKVEELLNEEIEYYVELDFEGFKNIIDALGGVKINVDQRMYKPTEDINLKAGEQLLDGRGALAYVRFRDYPMGDIERTEHQQEFLKALAKEILKPSTIPKLPTLAGEVRDNVTTNLVLKDILKMATWAPGFNSDSIVAQTLPGSFYDVRNSQGVLTASYWLADKSQTDNLLDTMLNGQAVAVVSDSTTTSNVKKTTGPNNDTKATNTSQKSPSQTKSI